MFNNTNVQDRSERDADNDAFENGWIVPKTVKGLIKTIEEFETEEDAYDKGWVIAEMVQGLVKADVDEETGEIFVWKPKQTEVIVWKK